MTFGKDRRFRRIQKLGDIIWIDNSRAETRHAPVLIADRNHNAVPEAVKAFAAIAFGKQTRLEQILLDVAALSEMLQSVVEARGRVPQPKGLDGCVGQSARLM